MQLKDKIIAISGSSKGIGYAIAEQCLKEGAKVMIHGRRVGRAQEAAKTFAETYGEDRVTAVSLDISDPNACEQLIAATVEQFGRLDGLVNNAGIYPRSNIQTSDAEFFNKVIAINLRAPLLITRAAVAQFRQQKSPGNITTIGSINAHCGQPDLLVYSMSKGGLVSMTRNLGDALGTEKIRVNLLNVGWTPTETEKELKRSEGLEDGWEDHVSPVFAPTGQLLQPEEIAHHAVFWQSDNSAPVTGAVYDVEQYPLIGRNKIAG